MNEKLKQQLNEFIDRLANADLREDVENKLRELRENDEVERRKVIDFINLTSPRKDMDYDIKITVTGRHVSYDFDPNIPYMLALEIQRVVDDFYKED